MKSKIWVNLENNSALKTYLFVFCFSNQGALKFWVGRFTPRQFLNNLYFMTWREPTKKKSCARIISEKNKNEFEK